MDYREKVLVEMSGAQIKKIASLMQKCNTPPLSDYPNKEGVLYEVRCESGLDVAVGGLSRNWQ
jgi:hypothetical protein